jgi:hypothetical protein
MYVTQVKEGTVPRNTKRVAFGLMAAVLASTMPTTFNNSLIQVKDACGQHAECVMHFGYMCGDLKHYRCSGAWGCGDVVEPI